MGVLRDAFKLKGFITGVYGIHDSLGFSMRDLGFWRQGLRRVSALEGQSLREFWALMLPNPSWLDKRSPRRKPE